MEGYDAATYGQSTADVYDDWHPGAKPEQLELLCRLAGDGPVLELGIGTGRLALPLASRGLQVHGIDSSGAMLAKLQSKRPVLVDHAICARWRGHSRRSPPTRTPLLDALRDVRLVAGPEMALCFLR